MDLFLEDADERQVAVALRVVEAVADHELIRHHEAVVIGIDGAAPPRGLVEQRHDLDRGGLPRVEHVGEVVEGEAGIHDVLNDDDVASRDAHIEVLVDADDAGMLGAVAVGRGGEKVDLAVIVELTHEIAEEMDRSLHDADEDGVLAPVFLGQYRAELFDLGAQLLLRDEDVGDVVVKTRFIDHLWFLLDLFCKLKR